MFLLLFTLATPKVYRIYQYLSDPTVTEVCITPILHKCSGDGTINYRFAKLEPTILLGELLGSIAVGFIVWVFASAVCSRKDDPKQVNTPTPRTNMPSCNPDPPKPPPDVKPTNFTPKHIDSDETPRQLFVEIYKSIPELPIRGGWGYSIDDAVIIDKNDPIVSKGLPFNGVSIEYIFVEKRIYCELIVFRPRNDRYAGITWDLKLQTLREVNGKRYDVLTFDVTALHDKHQGELKAIWEGPNGFGSPGFNKEEHFRKHDALTIHYVAEYWFDITSFYGSSERDNEEFPSETL
jgi:hypothetical protein